ncbi:MAG: dihydrolipoyl dehydrogenase [Christensenellales bacterium]|jgi:dihydrolipoamide dehydrogenase
MSRYDVAVLGAGPGGYAAAIRCAQEGLSVVLIEADELGGTCLNRGCIPTKALLHAAQLYESAKDAEKYGVLLDGVGFDFRKMAMFKDGVVGKLRRGIAGLEKAYGVAVVKGLGALLDAHRIAVGDRVVEADKIILATGAAPSLPPISGVDGERVLTSDQVLAMESCPDSLVIIGGGVIGIEFATLFASLGRKVKVLEAMPQILGELDEEILQSLMDQLQEKGVEVFTSAKVLSIRSETSQVRVEYEQDGKNADAVGEYCVVCTGRRPNTADIGLEAAGVRMDGPFVEVDETMATSVATIYAIGDITGKMQLAHVATEQGMVAAANCAGKGRRMRYEAVPACIYTQPEIAFVGKTRQQAQQAGIDVSTGSFPVSSNGKAMIEGAQRGVAKIVTDAGTGEVVGAQIAGPRATELIAEICAVMRCEGCVEEIAETIHPHPSVSEVWMEAANDVMGRSCHKPPVK